MKKFKTILSFELSSFLKNRVFVGVTLFFVVAIAIALSFPRISALFKSEERAPENRPVMLYSSSDPELSPVLGAALQAAFDGYELKSAEGDISDAIRAGTAECGVEASLTEYKYYVENVSMHDSNEAVIRGVLTELYRAYAFTEAGVPAGAVSEILTREITGETLSIGEDKTMNFLYTYIMVIVLYMVIMLYGQLVAAGVAAEKSNRAMELLITSSSPISMMFGKVLACGIAGLGQIAAIFGSAVVFYGVNKSYWTGSELIESLFAIPASLLVYMLLFFVLGFFLYAFLYGAVGSTVSKTEDVGTASMPINMAFIVVYMVVLVSLSTGSVDNVPMKILSFFPLTSPMAMFARIAMSTVTFWEIAVSIGLLVAGVAMIGVLAAKIYRVGVLMYGTRPKLPELLKALRKA